MNSTVRTYSRDMPIYWLTKTTWGCGIVLRKYRMKIERKMSRTKSHKTAKFREYTEGMKIKDIFSFHNLIHFLLLLPIDA
jgi:hypothetical protein